MSIFDKDRIGKSVLCEVRHETSNETRQAYVRWVGAFEGTIIARAESIGDGWLEGPWVVEKVDVPFQSPFS